MNESYLVGLPHVFIDCPLVSSVVDQLIIMSLRKDLKPSTDSGGTNSNLELLPDPNAEVVSLLGRLLWLLLTKK